VTKDKVWLAEDRIHSVPQTFHIKKGNSEADMSDNDYVVTQKEAADFLKVSTKSISRYRKRGLPYKLILNPVTGKQEVRFRLADLERWDEGRQLLATYARDGEETAAVEAKASYASGRQVSVTQDDGFLHDLLSAYKQQIELLREQLEDMRGQLARRDRQIDDLMRLMVGLQLEYKPLPAATNGPTSGGDQESNHLGEDQMMDLYETVVLPPSGPAVVMPEAFRPAPPSRPEPDREQKTFSREQLSASIQRLRRKGKSFDEIARGLNQINVATVSGHPEWTAREVQTLLPSLVDAMPRSLPGENSF
jgi:phage terminase Nu1 subunit (DNA packaging protein)